MLYSHHYLSIVSSIDTLMSGFLHSKKDIGYGYRWTFQNGQRVDLIDYKKWKVFLRVGRGAWLVRSYPMLAWYFDEVATVIAKLEIKDVAILDEKHIVWVFALLDQAPKWIKVFD